MSAQASTRRLLAGMSRGDLEVYGAALGLDPTREDLLDAALERLEDPAWVLAVAQALPPASRLALLTAAWAYPEAVDPGDGLAVAPTEARPSGAESLHRRGVGASRGGLGALALVDASGLWLAEPAPGPDDPPRRLVPAVTAAVLRSGAAQLVGGPARLTALPPVGDPGERLAAMLAELVNAGARLRGDGTLAPSAAARVAERLSGFVAGGGDADALGLLARVALRAGWLTKPEDGRLRFGAAALTGAAPSRDELIAVVVAGVVAAAPPLGSVLALLCDLPPQHAIPLRLYDALLASCRDPRVYDLDPGGAAALPPIRAAVGLLALAGTVLVARHDDDLHVLLHPEARSALRGEPRLLSVAAPVMADDGGISIATGCPTLERWRVAAVAEGGARGEQWRLSRARLQAMLDGGVPPAEARAWMLGWCARDDLPASVRAVVDGAVGPERQCEVLQGIPVRLGEDAASALEAAPDLGALVLHRSGPLVVLHPAALALLPGWARGAGLRLLGAPRGGEAPPPAPPGAGGDGWRALPGRLVALLRELREPADPAPYLPGCEDVVYPPLLALGGDDEAASEAERLVTGLLMRAPRDPVRRAPPMAHRSAAWEAAPPEWRRLTHAGALDLTALLRAALAGGLPVEAHVALGGRRVVPRVLVPGALEPLDAPTAVFPADEPAPIRLRDIRAVRLLDPRDSGAAAD